MAALIRQCIRLRYDPQTWKTAKEVMLYKLNKVNYRVVKSYQVISLLNCLGKVSEKVAANMLENWCKIHHILQMRSQR